MENLFRKLQNYILKNKYPNSKIKLVFNDHCNAAFNETVVLHFTRYCNNQIKANT